MMNQQTALITGASRGFGRAVAGELVGRGWSVVGLVRTRADADDFTATLAPRGTGIVGDVADPALPCTLQQHLPLILSHVDLLVNNAGIVGSGKSVANLDLDEMARLMEVHCYGPIRCIQGCLELLRRSPNPTIVNVSSRLGSVSKVASGAFDEVGVSYSMRVSKAAQNMLSAAISRELVPQGFRVLAVHPGLVATPMGNPGAALSPQEAAHQFVEWVLADVGPSSGFFEPGKGVLSW
jgi:NAD(P)-dependent dehydrogenase (short-subunit alcohol dehydrogenase family)